MSNDNQHANLNNPFDLKTMVDYQDGSIVSRMIVKGDAGSVTVFAFDAGQSLSEHTVPFDALLNVVDGESTVTIAGSDHLVISGQSIVMPRDVPHRVRADQRFKMVLTMIRLHGPFPERAV